MKRGLVVGEIWATRKASGLSGRPLKLVVEYPEYSGHPEHSAHPEHPSGPAAQPALATLGLAPLVVAVDTLDVRSGQEVLLAYGSGARNVLVPGPDNRYELCDAAVAMLIEPDPDPEPDPVQAPPPAKATPGSAARDDRAPATRVAKRGA
jgi:microcompartment protein CcmK/EutM